MYRFDKLTKDNVTAKSAAGHMPERIRCMLERPGCDKEINADPGSPSQGPAGGPIDPASALLDKANKAGWCTLTSWEPLCPACVSAGVELRIADHVRLLLSTDIEGFTNDDGEWELFCGNCDREPPEFPAGMPARAIVDQLTKDGWMAIPSLRRMVICPACKSTLPG